MQERIQWLGQFALFNPLYCRKSPKCPGMSWGLAASLRVHRAQRSGAGLSPTTVPVSWESFFSIDCQLHWTCLWNLSWGWLFLVTACGHVWNGGSGSESLTVAVAVKGFLLSEPEFYQQWVVPWGVQENSTESSYRLPALATHFLWPLWVSSGPLGMADETCLCNWFQVWLKCEQLCRMNCM